METWKSFFMYFSGITSIQYPSPATCLPWRIAHARSPQPYLWWAQGELHGEANAKRQAVQGAVEHDRLGLSHGEPYYIHIYIYVIYTSIYVYMNRYTWYRYRYIYTWYMDIRSALIHGFGNKYVYCDVVWCYVIWHEKNAMCTPNLWQFVCPQSMAILIAKNNGLVLGWRRDTYLDI